MIERQKKVLLVVGDADLAQAITLGLAGEARSALEFLQVASLADAARTLESEFFDVLLLDLAQAAGSGKDITLLDHKSPIIAFFGGAGSAWRFAAESPALANLQQTVAGALARAEADSRTVRRALYDEFTGLPTRALLLDLLNHAVARAQRSGLHVAFVPLTLHGLDDLEDRFGRTQAESIYKSLLKRLTGSLRTSDIVAALGGAEFGILMETRNGFDDAVLVAERVREIMSDTFSFGEDSLQVAMTLRGPVMCDSAVEDLDALLQRADLVAVDPSMRSEEAASASAA